MAAIDAQLPRRVDPIRLAELVLATTLHADADGVFIEPTDARGDTYTITFERARQPLASATLDGTTAEAAIARLAYLAKLDLASSSPSSALVPVRSGERRAEIVVTIRPGAFLRADLMVAPAADKVRAPGKPDLEPGDTVGHYRIVEWLGQGGMGTVYVVEHAVLERRYAMKILRTQDRAAAQQFLREARAAARLRHPHIVDVFDFGYVADARPFFVMELLDGMTLNDLIAKSPLEPLEAARVVQQLARALETAHDNGVVHADVTLSNVMVVARTPIHVKLVDFGLSKIAGEPVMEDPDGPVFGTPAFISPEQLCGLPASDRSDQYSLGCVFYALLTGAPPYDGGTTAEICKQQVYAPIPRVHSPFGPLSPKLCDIVTTCLQKSPQQRFPGMRALLAALDDVIARMDTSGWRKWLS